MLNDYKTPNIIKWLLKKMLITMNDGAGGTHNTLFAKHRCLLSCVRVVQVPRVPYRQIHRCFACLLVLAVRCLVVVCARGTSPTRTVPTSATTQPTYKVVWCCVFPLPRSRGRIYIYLDTIETTHGNKKRRNKKCPTSASPLPHAYYVCVLPRGHFRGH